MKKYSFLTTLLIICGSLFSQSTYSGNLSISDEVFFKGYECVQRSKHYITMTLWPSINSSGSAVYMYEMRTWNWEFKTGGKILIQFQQRKLHPIFFFLENYWVEVILNVWPLSIFFCTATHYCKNCFLHGNPPLSRFKKMSAVLKGGPGYPH